MDHLWAPWRREFIDAPKEEGCIFCHYPAETGPAADRKNLIVGRTARSFVILNKYPYNNGHLMVVPRRHTGDYASLDHDELDDLQHLLQIALKVVEEAYHPGGANLGMNLGKAAGAGIAGHIHMHALPRWVADANFVSVIGETRILPETLDVTWGRMRKALKK